MKFFVILLTGIAAIAYAAPNPMAEADLKVREASPGGDPYCHLVGQACKVKRTDEAELKVREANPGGDPFCHLPGQACRKLKRAADVINEALSEPITAPALAVRDPQKDPFCHLPGQACKKMKRSLDDLSVVARYASAFGDDNEKFSEDSYKTRVKRAADEVNEILRREDNEYATALRARMDNFAAEV